MASNFEEEISFIKTISHATNEARVLVSRNKTMFWEVV
jgi:hypothetical protein